MHEPPVQANASLEGYKTMLRHAMTTVLVWKIFGTQEAEKAPKANLHKAGIRERCEETVHAQTLNNKSGK